jgi:hypothetical protein
MDPPWDLFGPAWFQAQARLTLGISIDKGRNLVPREGPPTKMTALVVFAAPPLGLLASDGGWRLMVAMCAIPGCCSAVGEGIDARQRRGHGEVAMVPDTAHSCRTLEIQ